MDVSKLMFREGLMAGERILVTGGGTGLGREMAEGFLKLGATVYICGRRQNKLDETAAELTALHGGKIVGHACDIRDADAIHAMIDAAIDHDDGGIIALNFDNFLGFVLLSK
jgi:NAD(P)-dependent dehydrogenase (short-subunit alcohol dehydrogenase family)